MTGLGLQFRLLQRPLLSFHPETPGHRNRFRQSQNPVDELGGEAIVKLNSQSPLRSRPKPWRKPRMSLAGLIHVEVPNRLIGTFPFMFVPGFFVPLAVVLDVLAIRSITSHVRTALDTP